MQMNMSRLPSLSGLGADTQTYQTPKFTLKPTDGSSFSNVFSKIQNDQIGAKTTNLSTGKNSEQTLNSIQKATKEVVEILIGGGSHKEAMKAVEGLSDGEVGEVIKQLMQVMAKIAREINSGNSTSTDAEMNLGMLLDTILGMEKSVNASSGNGKAEESSQEDLIMKLISEMLAKNKDDKTNSSGALGDLASIIMEMQGQFSDVDLNKLQAELKGESNTNGLVSTKNSVLYEQINTFIATLIDSRFGGGKEAKTDADASGNNTTNIINTANADTKQRIPVLPTQSPLNVSIAPIIPVTEPVKDNHTQNEVNNTLPLEATVLPLIGNIQNNPANLNGVGDNVIVQSVIETQPLAFTADVKVTFKSAKELVTEASEKTTAQTQVISTFEDNKLFADGRANRATLFSQRIVRNNSELEDIQLVGTKPSSLSSQVLSAEQLVAGLSQTTNLVSQTANPDVSQIPLPVRAGVETQIMENLLPQMKNPAPGTSVMVINLKPAELGEIAIKLVNEAGKISVSIAAQSQATTKILQDRLPTLISGLQSNGTEVKEIRIVESTDTSSFMGFNLNDQNQPGFGQSRFNQFSEHRQGNKDGNAQTGNVTENLNSSIPTTKSEYRGGNLLWQMV